MDTYFVDARSATPHFPGIGRHITNLVMALREEIAAGEELKVLIPPGQAQLRNQELPWSDTMPEQAQLRFITSQASNFGLGQQWSVPRLIQQARSPQRSRALYHSPYYLMPYRTGLPTILTLHDLIALLLPETVSMQARWFFRLAVFAALRASTHVITCTESTRQALLARYPIDSSRVTAVPNAPAARFHPQPEAAIEAVRASYQLPEAFLFYCGINKPHKNLVRLIDAFAELDSTAPPLVIAGPWDKRYPESKQRVNQRGLEGRIRFLGRVSDQELPALYAAATLFVFPSLYEGFGLPVIEAMACGTPVACSDAAGLRDITGDAALLFDPQDTGAIVIALRTAVENPGLRAELRQRALAQAQRFSWSSTAQQTLAIYRQVLREKATLQRAETTTS